METVSTNVELMLTILSPRRVLQQTSHTFTLTLEMYTQEVRSVLREETVSVTVREKRPYEHASNNESDSLRDGRSGDRIPVESRFSAPVQTGPGANPASYTMGTGSFPGRGFDHPPPN